MRFRGTLFERLGKHGARVESTFDADWSESGVLSVFGEETYEVKDFIQLWDAARYREGASRGNAGIEVRYGAVLDRDCSDPGALDDTARHLDALGIAYIIHTSWSHLDPEKKHESGAKAPFDCFRVVLPYSREVAPGEHASIVLGLFGHELPSDPGHYHREVLGRFIELPSGRFRAARPRGWDPSSLKPAQPYYAPVLRAGREEVFSLDVRAGSPIDVDAVLARPSTPRVSHRRPRPYTAPDAQAIGALGRFSAALERAGVGGLSYPSLEGWCRTTCPSCQDPSPSLTARANGDGLDLKCHAGCERHDILSAVDFDDRNLARPPSYVRQRFEEQLERQPPPEVTLDVDEAVARLTADIRESVEAREATVIKYPAGTGKSYASAIVMTECARRGERVAYVTQEHRVAAETRRLLPPDVLSVHIHSPLIQVGDEPVCRRRAELTERVFDFGVSLLGSICPRCPFREECEALAAAKERAELLPLAQVIFVSHAGVEQITGLDEDGLPKNLDLRIIVDEMPSAYERVEVSHEELIELSENARLFSGEATVARAVMEVATAIIEGRAPGEARWGRTGSVIGDASAILVEARRFRLREGARPRAEERGRLRAADALVRVWCAKEAGLEVNGLTEPDSGVWAMSPDACHTALVERRGVLLSATPMLAALPGFRLREVEVKDGAPVKRVMVLRKDRGHGALKESFYDDSTGVRALRDPSPGEPPGIPWATVDAALERGRREAALYGPGSKVLFVSFKVVIDALRARGVPEDVELGHYGALRGKNDWQEGARGACSVAYLFGTPRFAVREMLTELGLVGEEADNAWVEYAAGELAQAEGRLRLPRRRTPCTVFVEGDVAPLSWHSENISEIDEAADPETASGLLEGALRLRTVSELSALLGEPVIGWVRAGAPEIAVEALRAAARPGLAESCGLLARATPGRKKRLRELFSWEPLTDEDGVVDE